MRDGKCAVCLAALDMDEAEILTISGFGAPRYLCPDCSNDFNVATTSHDFKAVEEAMAKVGDKLAKGGIEDGQTLDTVTEIFNGAAARAAEIKNGTYDFSLDEEEDEEGLDTIPEDLLETEEDRLLDEKEREQLRKFDTVMNWIILALGAAACVFLVLYFLIL